MAWMLVLGLVLAWVLTLCVLIVTAPPAGAASPAELAQQATTALNGGDAAALARLLAAPLDHEFAAAYVERLQQAGAQNITVTLGSRDLVTISGRTPAGPFAVGLVAQAQDGRWFLTPLPPVRAL
jgi:hypothetical protein